MKTNIVETDEQQKDAFAVRREVFVEEQNVPPEIEIDELENEAIHFVGYDKEKAIAAGRLRLVDDYGKLERVCVLKPYRGLSFGKQIISEMERVIKEKGYPKAKLNAQTHAEAFYLSLGYKTISDEFMDAGIPHVTMIKLL
ncbi:GNAT family N-acetyltransferase [Aquibacillus koreensis]|uniref:GNAT family N-acetyltransferase n=1 Tax=Aquibacillus koreensis TaxID=279446 RepID=A0A9X3WMM2_9BACI|nr:GNAT family N-acetyltransferase [Aquibacillus koreensis]MCT2535681.1 GNAT family N-acetyltransferase [Aquibacillus koreensis]MDC3420034.1 GNAT family N-acetyltransferase [Aquibacillus koreensis]